MSRKKRTTRKRRAMRKKRVKIYDFIFFENGSLGFWGWLPLGKANALKFRQNSLEFHVYVEPKYTETFHFTPDLSDLSNSNHWVRALKVDVYFDVTNNMLKAINRMNPPKMLIKKIAQAYRILNNSFRDIVRHDIGQWWTTHSFFRKSELPRDILGGMHIQCSHCDRSKQFLMGATVDFKSRIPRKGELISKRRWKKLEKLIGNQYRTDVALVCLANANAHYYSDNFRIALLEGTIALERAIAEYLPRYISKSKLAFVEEILKKRSLRAAVKDLLPLIARKRKIENETVIDCYRAVEARNHVIHKTRFRLDPIDMKDYMKAINAVVKKLIPRQF
ncbi:hypothetical protein ES705_06826 [subsurface metagenome]